MTLNNRNVAMILTVSLFNILNARPVEWAKETATDFVFSSATHAKLFSLLLYNDKELASRYVQYNQIHRQKTTKKGEDFVVNHVVYTLVDHVVDHGMNGLNNVKYVRAITEDIPSKEKKFIKNNAQIMVSAGVIRLGRAAHEGKISQLTCEKDGVQFGKACAVQVGCNAADEYIIKPFVEERLGDSLTGQVVSFVLNYALSSFIVGQVNQK